MKTVKTTLILGLGNEILSDDGIGPRLIDDLAPIISDPDVEFGKASSGGLEIMELIKGYRKVVFIDAIRTLNGKPGKVHYFLPADFKETSNLSSLHDVNFITALHLGRMLELGLPDDLHIIAVEIVGEMEFSEGLTPLLEKRYPEILGEVSGHIIKILNLNAGQGSQI